MGFPAIFYKYMIQQYFPVSTPNTIFWQYIKQIIYQMLVVVHSQSEGNETTMGFPAIFYKYLIWQYCTLTAATDEVLSEHIYLKSTQHSSH